MPRLTTLLIFGRVLIIVATGQVTGTTFDQSKGFQEVRSVSNSNTCSTRPTGSDTEVSIIVGDIAITMQQEAPRLQQCHALEGQSGIPSSLFHATRSLTINKVTSIHRHHPRPIEAIATIPDNRPLFATVLASGKPGSIKVITDRSGIQPPEVAHAVVSEVAVSIANARQRRPRRVRLVVAVVVPLAETLAGFELHAALASADI